jgi:hypothetical protein
VYIVVNYTTYFSLFNLAAARAHGLADVAADGAGVGLGALAACREALAVAAAAVAADVFEALDVAGNLALEVALELDGLERSLRIAFSSSAVRSSARLVMGRPWPWRRLPWRANANAIERVSA